MLLWIFWCSCIIYIWQRIGRNFISVRDASAWRYKHGFVWKAQNRCQALHKTFAIGIERLYLHKTCTTHAPEELQVAYVTHYEEFGKIRSLEFVKKYLAGFLSVKDNALAGKFGKTAQSRFQYCILVNLQQKLHYVINITDFDYRLQC